MGRGFTGDRAVTNGKPLQVQHWTSLYLKVSWWYRPQELLLGSPSPGPIPLSSVRTLFPPRPLPLLQLPVVPGILTYFLKILSLLC